MAMPPSQEDPVLKEGYLVKKGHVLRTQKERYFVLRAHSLQYFRVKRSTPSDRQIGTRRGVLPLAASDVIAPLAAALWFRIQKLPGSSQKSYKLDLKGGEWRCVACARS